MKINIVDPCHENWNAMTPNEKGRFCDACQKTVVDFSKMSDLEIYHALHNKSGKICGRISSQQIQNFNAAHEELPTSSNLKKWSLAAMLAGVLAYPNMTQAEVHFENALLASMPVFNQNITTKNIANESVKTPVDTISITIKVINGLQQPIPNANVSILGTNIHLLTDSMGFCKISIPKSNELSITAAAEGYIEQTITNSLESKTDFVFELLGLIEPPMWMGLILIEEPEVKKVNKNKAKARLRKQ